MVADTTRLIEILVPTAAAPEGTQRLAPPLPDLCGKRVGFRIEGSTDRRGDALYKNFSIFADRLKELLEAKFRPAAFPRLGITYDPATRGQVYDRFAAESDCAILGIAG